MYQIATRLKKEGKQRKRGGGYKMPQTLPVVGTRCPKVNTVGGEATADAHLAHAGLFKVSVGVAQLIVVNLPLVIRIKAQIIATDVALPHHASLVLITGP